MFWAYFLTEIKYAFRNKNLIMLLFVAPIALPLWFGGTYLNDYLNHIPIAIVDADNTQLSRSMVQMIGENERFTITHQVDTKEQLEALMDEKTVYGGVYIPKDMSKNVKEGTPANIVLLTNGTNAVISNNVYGGIATIVGTVSGGATISLISAKGSLPPTVAQNIFYSFQTGERVLFDPKMTYMNYMIFGLLSIILQQLTISAMSIFIARNPHELAQRHMFWQLMGKIAACFLGFTFSISLVIGLLHFLVGVPLRGHLFGAYCFCFLFLVAMLCPIVFLFAIFKNHVKMAQVCFTISMPVFLTSGFIWPLAQCPKILVTAVSVLWPYIHFGRPFADLLIKGTSIWVFLPNILALLAYIAIWLPISVAFFRYRYRDPVKQEVLLLDESAPK